MYLGILDGYNHRGLIGWQQPRGFLVFSPHPRGDRFANILQCFLFIATLRDAPGLGGAFGHDPAIFRFLKGDVKEHLRPFCSRLPFRNLAYSMGGVTFTGYGSSMMPSSCTAYSFNTTAISTAVGTATIAPMMPASADPISRAMRMVNPARST